MNKGLKIEKQGGGRRIAIGDIHGCSNTFQLLVEDKIQLNKKDQLFLLGDYIDKGKRSREVLEYILQLIKNGFSVFPLMGNHEYFVLSDIEFCKVRKGENQLKDIIESKDLLNVNGEIENRYLTFISNLPYFYELDDFILVHAGLNFNEAFPLEDTSSMIYIRKFKVDRGKIGDKTVVHGHSPIGFDKVKEQIATHQINGKINLDNGCVYKNDYAKRDRGLGQLCGLDLDELKLFSVENID